MKKKLPKAVLWKAEDMLASRTDAASSSETMRLDRVSSLPEPVATDAVTTGAATAGGGVTAATDGRAAVAANANAKDIVAADLYWSRRRQLRATTLVERHANFSAVGGVIPLPIANVAAVTAIIVRMVKSLSELYGVPFEHDRARTIVVGLMGGLVPTGLAAVTTSTLAYVVPASNLLGLAVSSITAAACTRNIGRIFVDHFESGATLAAFPSTRMR